ncbi:Cytochrome b5 reductase 4 [Apodemus speciosus]|uniref:Cytochrome b5 reductase 4 n=1 Tax=Apodemus speciosus TaxID=105296 RepID=A0ABQ0F5K8_APOSI
MDWIRLTKSGKDLTGLKGGLIEVTEEELKKHNKKDDCWICIRGFVYNVSPYMEYHPGGEDELMRAAGADGTDLFNEVHRWVNYESMLKECLVGRMAVKPAVPKDCHEGKRVLNALIKILSGIDEFCCAVGPRSLKLSFRQLALLRGRVFFWTTLLTYAALTWAYPEGYHCMLPKSQVTDILPREGPSSPSYDWFQTESSVTIVIYTKQKNINLDSVIVDLLDDSLRAETVIKDHSYLIHIGAGLSHEVQENFSVRVIENVGKIEIVLQKKENVSWKYLGDPLEKHDSFIPKKDTGLHYRQCRLIAKEDATHDTRLFCLKLPPSTHLQVPVGQHVYLKLSVTGAEIVKPYTPVSDSLLSDFKEPVLSPNKYIYFLIKIYPAGLFTPELDRLQIGGPEGNFKVSKLQEVEDLFLLAAGTGFTPMVTVLNYALAHVSSLRKVKLMFFNKTEDDIIWRCQLEKLALRDKRYRMEMSAQKLASNRTSPQSPTNPDYTWEYEYYEIGPVSFEGLKAHKYSIVIGFWVGLAVFVIFMFFVLTLLTKTGAPHQDNAESSEKRFRMNSFVSDFGKPLESDKVFSRQGNEESRSLFHCYINEVEHLDRVKVCHRTTAIDSDVHLQEAIRSGGRPEEELTRFMNFDIPNFVNTDQNSFGEDDLLISEPPVLLENKPVSQTSRIDLG